jgi:DNA (cytosine-5)-methyltransferase 1
MKMLNLYAGIGGNRKLWTPQGDEHEITAVEYDENIAKMYQDFFPNDKVIVGDAHQYLLDNFEKYDFIWSSPPCPTHSDIRRMSVQSDKTGKVKAKYPDMGLYQEVILLQTFFKGGYCVENVIPYYKPLIPAQQKDRHLFWANFAIPDFNKEVPKHHKTIQEQQDLLGYDLTKYKVDKRKVLRNCVMPNVGKQILEAYINQQPRLI